MTGYAKFASDSAAALPREQPKRLDARRGKSLSLNIASMTDEAGGLIRYTEVRSSDESSS